MITSNIDKLAPDLISPKLWIRIRFTTVEHCRIDPPAPDLRVQPRGFIRCYLSSDFLSEKFVTDLNELNLSINGSNVSRLSEPIQSTEIEHPVHNLLNVRLKDLSDTDDTIRWHI